MNKIVLRKGKGRGGGGGGGGEDNKNKKKIKICRNKHIKKVKHGDFSDDEADSECREAVHCESEA